MWALEPGSVYPTRFRSGVECRPESHLVVGQFPSDAALGTITQRASPLNEMTPSSRSRICDSLELHDIVIADAPSGYVPVTPVERLEFFFARELERAHFGVDRQQVFFHADCTETVINRGARLPDGKIGGGSTSVVSRSTRRVDGSIYTRPWDAVRIREWPYSNL